MNVHINITYRDKDGNIIENPYKGQLAHSPETSQLYIYKDGGWELVQASGTNLQMTMYNMNKQLIAQLKPLKNEEIDKGIKDIKEFMILKANTFYTLLCRDINYYTLFHCVDKIAGYDEEPAAADEVVACASEVGVIKSIEVMDNTVVEIWVHTEGEDEPLPMYLFPYVEGVITCTL